MPSFDLLGIDDHSVCLHESFLDWFVASSFPKVRKIEELAQIGFKFRAIVGWTQERELDISDISINTARPRFLPTNEPPADIPLACS